MFDLGSLNPQQRAAVETLRGPLLILAGAGTGKTRVITCRVAHLIRNGVDPSQILAVTFTNKAAREMKQRVAQLIPAAGQAGALTICTFHALGVRLLREHIGHLGYKPDFTIYAESDQLAIVQRLLSHIHTSGPRPDPGAVVSLISRLRNKGGGAAAAALPDDHDPQADLAHRLVGRYESALRAASAVDFDDLLLLPLRLFERHPAVLEACRRRFRHVLVDEYQDTNAAQFQLLRLLTLEHRNLCVVGDDDQSIYGWRGAEASNLLDLERHYPELRVIKLEQNYRSTNAILNAANAIIRHNPRRRGKQLWSRNGEGAKLRLFTFASDADEAKSLAEELQFQRAVRRVPWGQHAILFRMNAQARPIETALRQAGIAYRLIGGQSFFDRREIKDFLAYLRVLLQPRDDASLLRIANVPARGLSDATLHQLLAASQQRHAPVFEVMRDPAVRGALPARAAEAVGAFVRLIEGQRQALEACAPANLPAWAEALFDGIGYYAELRRAEKESGENRVRNLRELIADLAPAPPDRSALQHLERWVDELLLESDRTESKEAPADAVTLITIHSCKGLEFPLVHIVGVEDGILPHARSKEEGTLDEERRLFYVAMTRAMRGLSLSYCLARKKYGQSMPCHPSPFLKELPAELVETDAERATRKLSVSDGQAMFAHLRAAIG